MVKIFEGVLPITPESLYPIIRQVVFIRPDYEAKWRGGKSKSVDIFNEHGERVGSVEILPRVDGSMVRIRFDDWESNPNVSERVHLDQIWRGKHFDPGKRETFTALAEHIKLVVLGKNHTDAAPNVPTLPTRGGGKQGERKQDPFTAEDRETEIARKKKIVADANKRRAKTGDTWKAIARHLGVPERTLRDWRHNPLYK